MGPPYVPTSGLANLMEVETGAYLRLSWRRLDVSNAHPPSVDWAHHIAWAFCPGRAVCRVENVEDMVPLNRMLLGTTQRAPN